MPYHNTMHAADVTMMMHHFLLASNMAWVSPIEHLTSLLAAAVHDVGHDGVNNLFHTKAFASKRGRHHGTSREIM